MAKTPKINPLKGVIYLNLKETSVGVLDISSRSSAVEYAEVIAVGKEVEDIKSGDHVFVKSWGLDMITHEGNKYWFIHTDTNAILAIVK